MQKQELPNISQKMEKPQNKLWILLLPPVVCLFLTPFRTIEVPHIKMEGLQIQFLFKRHFKMDVKNVL